MSRSTNITITIIIRRARVASIILASRRTATKGIIRYRRTLLLELLAITYTTKGARGTIKTNYSFIAYFLTTWLSARTPRLPLVKLRTRTTADRALGTSRRAPITPRLIPRSMLISSCLGRLEPAPKGAGLGER